MPMGVYREDIVMNSIKVLVRSSIVGLGLTVVTAAPVFACHPVGVITKTVGDVTTNGAQTSAETDATALTVNSGDTLAYVVKVSDTGAAESNGDDDMLNTVLTDNLPAGVELVSDPSETTITDNLGTITPGQTVTETYDVKVTSDTNGAYLTNKACYTGQSVDNADNQSGCDAAIVEVNVPAPAPSPSPSPSPTPTPTTTTTTTPAASLPNTGPGNIVGIAAVFAVAGTVFSYVRRAKRTA